MFPASSARMYITPLPHHIGAARFVFTLFTYTFYSNKWNLKFYNLFQSLHSWFCQKMPCHTDMYVSELRHEIPLCASIRQDTNCEFSVKIGKILRTKALLLLCTMCVVCVVCTDTSPSYMSMWASGTNCVFWARRLLRRVNMMLIMQIKL